jgi:protein involved in polysaccharide export with SLBB domain
METHRVLWARPVAALLFAVTAFTAGPAVGTAQMPSTDLFGSESSPGMPSNSGIPLDTTRLRRISEDGEDGGSFMPSESLGLDGAQSARVRRAMSDPRYPVTPGDVYRLTFTQATQSEQIQLYVAPDYGINMDFLGRVDAQGLTFNELRDEIQTIVENSYPGSSMRLTIAQTGEFPIFIRGEVTQAQELYAWGLTRLGSLPDSLFTDAASFRNIRVVGPESGQGRTVDLFRARRFGERDQNPLLQPGQTIVVPRFDRRVQVRGAVMRPGTYDLLPEEDYGDLLDFAGGYTATADRQTIELTRYVPAGESPAEGSAAAEGGRPERTDYLNAGELRDTELRHLDRITVLDRMRNQAYFFIEGAVRRPGGDEPQQGTNIGATGSPAPSARRLSQRIVPGQRLAEYLTSIQGRILTDADLGGAYLRRDKQLISVDILALLEGRLSLSANPVLQSGDVLVIPFRQLQVTVLGAVRSPGRYPYVPDRTWRYYVDLAGGFREDLNDFATVTIRDADGNPVELSDTIDPEDVIRARRDSPRYWFLRSLDVAGTSMNFTNALVSLLSTLGIIEDTNIFD